MTPLLRALTTAALVAGLVLSTTAAHAERWWAGDATGDVRQYAYTPEPPPCGTLTDSTAPQDASTDIVGLSVRHEGGSVELRAHFRELKAWGDRYVSFDLETDRRAYEVSVRRPRKRGPVEASLWQAAPPPESFDECGGYTTVQFGVPCTELLTTRSTSTNTVTVTVPRSCLRGPRWVRAGVSTDRAVGDRHRTDTWSRSGPDTVAFSGPFGPRVRRD